MLVDTGKQQLRDLCSTNLQVRCCPPEMKWESKGHDARSPNHKLSTQYLISALP